MTPSTPWLETLNVSTAVAARPAGSRQSPRPGAGWRSPRRRRAPSAKATCPPSSRRPGCSAETAFRETVMRATPSVAARPWACTCVSCCCPNGRSKSSGCPAWTLVRRKATRDCSRLCWSDGRTSAASTTSANSAEAAATTVSRIRRRPGRCSASRIMCRSGTRRRAPSGSAAARKGHAPASPAGVGCGRRSFAARGSRPSPRHSRAVSVARARGRESA